jgi:hypothetical protein
MVSLVFGLVMKPDRPQCFRRVRRSFKSFVASGTFRRAERYRRVPQQYWRYNIASALLRKHRGKSTVARRRGKSESMSRNAARSFPDFWVTEHGTAAKLKIADADFTLELRVP